MTYTYFPRGVCSRKIDITIEDGVITDLKFEGGCNGNTQGVARLAIGSKPEEVMEKLRGIRCGFKPTSCPDQLSIALEKMLAKENK